MLKHFLSIADSNRVAAVLQRLKQHNIQGWALTGGIAVGVHLVTSCIPSRTRSLNDLDFITARFDDIPETVGENFLFRHVHPGERADRTMMQLVDVDAQIRIDVFQAVGATLKRTSRVDLFPGRFAVVGPEDLIARTARLLLSLASGGSVPAKLAADFLLLSRVVEAHDVQPAWSDHRKPDHQKRLRR